MQTQINFLEMESRLDKIQDFVLSVLQEKNPQAYLEFVTKINQQRNNEEN